MFQRMDTPEAIGKRVRAARLTAGLSQEDLAQRAGCVTATVGRLERGTRTVRPRQMQQIADALGVPLPELMGEAPRPEPGQLDRIEAKLDRIITALDADQEPRRLPPPPELLRQSRKPKRGSR